MKTIIHLRNTFLPLSETFIYDQIKYLKSFSSLVLTRKYINREIFPLSGIKEIPTKTESLCYTIFRTSKFFEKIVATEKPILIHAHYGIEGVYALPLKKKFSLPLVISFYGHELTRLPRFTLYPPAWFNYWRYFYNLISDKTIFLPACKFLKNKLISHGFPENQIITHYIGIDTEYIDTIPQGDKKELSIITVGRLVEKKGTVYLLQAMEIIIRKYKNVQLIIVGDGPLRQTLEKLSDKLKLTKNVRFLGALSRPQIFSLMKKSTIFCLPSVTAANGDAEASPSVIKEAYACGLPTVSTYHAGIPEIVLNNETGFLVPERNIEMLAEKISLLLEDKSLSEKFGTNGREIIRDKFEIRKQTNKLEKIYQDILL